MIFVKTSGCWRLLAASIRYFAKAALRVAKALFLNNA